LSPWSVPAPLFPPHPCPFHFLTDSSPPQPSVFSWSLLWPPPPVPQTTHFFTPPPPSPSFSPPRRFLSFLLLSFALALISLPSQSPPFLKVVLRVPPFSSLSPPPPPTWLFIFFLLIRPPSCFYGGFFEPFSPPKLLPFPRFHLYMDPCFF